MSAFFRNRREAGRQLAYKLAYLAGDRGAIVLALPRGGVPVAHEIATALRLPLDVFVVRKIGVPGQEEVAMGAIASGGSRVINRAVTSTLGITDEEFGEAARVEELEVARRSALYRGAIPFPDLGGKTVVVVDDGIATGATMHVAVDAVLRLGPASVVVAAPVASRDALQDLSSIADRCVFLAVPHPFGSVGAYYNDFAQTTDEEVRECLSHHVAPARPLSLPRSMGLRIPCGRVTLDGDLRLPSDPRGLIVFAHGSGSSRLSKRNQQVAASLNEQRFATLLFDLLSEEEERRDRETSEFRFDIAFLANRLVMVTDWLGDHPLTGSLAIGYFGASTGAAAALVAAAQRPDIVRAVVSRGGRPDLAGAALAHVITPTLLIVGGNDHEVLALNRDAADRIAARIVRLTVVPGASHLFEEPGALERVARLAGEWFAGHIGVRGAVLAGT